MFRVRDNLWSIYLKRGTYSPRNLRCMKKGELIMRNKRNVLRLLNVYIDDLGISVSVECFCWAFSVAAQDQAQPMTGKPWHYLAWAPPKAKAIFRYCVHASFCGESRFDVAQRGAACSRQHLSTRECRHKSLKIQCLFYVSKFVTLATGVRGEAQITKEKYSRFYGQNDFLRLLAQSVSESILTNCLLLN